MFNFFRDIYAELNGLEPVKMNEEKSLKKKNLALSRAVKMIIRTVGILYILIAATSMISIFTNGINITILKYIIAVIIDIVVLIFTFGKSRQAEIIVAVGVVMFIGFNFLTQGIMLNEIQ